MKLSDFLLIFAWLTLVVVRFNGPSGTGGEVNKTPPIDKPGLHVLIDASHDERDANVVNANWLDLLDDLGGEHKTLTPGQVCSDDAYEAARDNPYSEPYIVVSSKPGGGERKPLADLTNDDIKEMITHWGG